MLRRHSLPQGRIRRIMSHLIIKPHPAHRVHPAHRAHHVNGRSR
jgi:hypothetical protein